MGSLVLDSPALAKEAREVVDSVAADSQVLIGVRVPSVGAELELSPEMSRTILDLLSLLSSGGTVNALGVPEILSTTEAARLLGISRPTLMKKIRAGELSSFKVGTHTRLRREEVSRFREEVEQRRKRALDELHALEEELDSGSVGNRR